MSISIHNNLETIRLNHNVSARLTRLSAALRRISAGTRLTRSADNAASLTINERLDTALRQAQEEARGAISQSSRLQSADGALAQMEERLQKMRALAVQAGSEVLAFEDRNALEKDFKALMSEIEDISNNTKFNGRALLSGDAPALSLSLSTDEDDLVYLPDVSARALGRQARASSGRRGVFLDPLNTGDLTLNGVAIRGTSRYDDQLSYSYASGSAIAKAKAINAATHFTGVRASVSETVIRADEPLHALKFDESHWIKINGVQISAFDLEEKDATGALRAAINHKILVTGVRAEVDSAGALVLIAEDGRNITIEYSDATARDALRIVDSFGDPNNLGDTIDPAVFVLNGDITSVSFVMNGGGNYDGGVSVVGDKLLYDLSVGDSSGRYTRPRDHVDYVLEVVKPGALGVATFRYKEEGVSFYTSDSLVEDYLFNAQGVVTSSTPLVAVQNTSYYNEASNRQYKLYVTKTGFPSAADPSNRPEYYYEVLNTDTGVIEYTSPVITATEGSPISLPHNLFIDYPTTSNAYNHIIGSTKLTPNALMSSSNALGDQYLFGPRFVSWAGEHITEFTFEVVSDGHAALSPIAGSNTPPAQIELRAYKPALGTTTSQTFTVSPNTNITFEGLTFSMVPQNFTPNVSRNQSGSYMGSVSTSNSVFVGPENLKYVVTALSDGKISTASTIQAQVAIYKSNNTLIDDSQRVTLRSSSNIQIGAGAMFEGVILNLSSSVATSSLSRTSGDYLSVSRSGAYTGESDEIGVFRVTQGGRPGQSAQFEYFYLSDPSEKLTGALQGNTTLRDGMTLSFTQPTAVMSSLSHVINASGPVATTVNASGYTAEQGATSIVIDVADDGLGGQDLVTTWTFADSSTAAITSPFFNNTSVNIGFGVTVNLQDPVLSGDRFTSAVSLNPLEVGDEWRLTLNNGAVRAGDTFTLQTYAADLVTGSQWFARGEVSEWIAGETYTLNAAQNYSPGSPLLLTPTINLPGVGELRLTGSGSFNTGDELRIHTRAYIGNVTSSGFYTNNLYPTEYRLSVTQSGPLGAAGLTWWRADGRTDTERGGRGLISPGDIKSGAPIYLEEGVYVAFSNPAAFTAYLSEGDLVRIPVGQCLNYTFAGKLTLQSSQNINLSYADHTQDNLLGRLLFMGDIALVNEQGGDDLSLQSGLIGRSTSQGLHTVGILSKGEVDEALTTIDLALAQVGEARATLGGALSELERRASASSQTALSLMSARLRLGGVDVAHETALMASEQIQLMSAPRLNELARTNALVALDLVRQGGR